MNAELLDTPTLNSPPNPWPRWALWFTTAMLPLMLVCIVLDRNADKLLTLLGWILLAVMAVADRDRSKGRLAGAVGVTVAVIAASGTFAYFAGSFSDAVSYFVKYQIGVLWLAISWIALPLFTSTSITERNRPGQRHRRFSTLSALASLLLAFSAWATFSAAASLFPKDSMELLGSELLPYAGLFILISRLASTKVYNFNSQGTSPLYVAPRSLWLITIIASLAMAAIALLALASAGLGKSFLDADLFRVDSDAPGTYRLQFLFHHHNRAGFFAACAVFLCLAGAFGGKWWRALGICGAIAAAVALPFTLTRGALIAAAAGMAFFTFFGLLSYRRGRWALLAAFLVSVPLIWTLLPEDYQQHIAKATNLKNYREGEGGSIGARFIMWENAVDMIDKRPVLGFGYGFENFVAAARHDNPEIPNYFQDAVHAHNQWLETGAETGFPGMLLLVGFTAMRIVWLAATWWIRMQQRHPLAWLLLLWLSLEITIQIYGLTNYTLRRNLGYFTYAIWAGSIVLIFFIQPRFTPTNSD